MKKITLLVMATMLSLIAAAQPHRWEKKPMSDFRNDTVEYIRHNFNSDDKNMQEHFKGKTIGEIIPELGFKVKYVFASGFINEDIVKILFVAISRGNRNGKFETTDGVSVWLETPVSFQNNPAAYNKLMSEDFSPFNKELLDLLKNMKVSDVRESGTELM